eukprot:TRINITY_DN113378_c0_g1_i1.p1 TRINITY_DN113378_c0_g1~~TRINITY_DN113378_c0_g1_i1.p1  ORF type:complete len:689 (-),score=57.90 TRINITY_DN113378_c0_g1_i1:50-2116(-)
MTDVGSAICRGRAVQLAVIYFVGLSCGVFLTHLAVQSSGVDRRPVSEQVHSLARTYEAVLKPSSAPAPSSAIVAPAQESSDFSAASRDTESSTSEAIESPGGTEQAAAQEDDKAPDAGAVDTVSGTQSSAEDTESLLSAPGWKQKRAARRKRDLPKRQPKQPWQCLLYDQGHGDAWCGTQKIKTATSSLKVVNNHGSTALYKGCGLCWCCMEAWPGGEDADIPDGEPHEIWDRIAKSANDTFERVSSSYSNRNVRVTLRTPNDLKTLRTALDGSTKLSRELQLGLFTVKRNHRILTFRKLPSSPRENVSDAGKIPSSVPDEGLEVEFSAIPSHCPRELWSLFPRWAKALEQLAHERAVDGTVFFTLTDKQYESALPCWHWSVTTVTGRQNTIIIPTDQATVAVCRKHKLPCVLVEDPADMPRIKIWGHIGFVKYYAMAILSRTGLDFIFSEMDVVVLENPWPYHETEDELQWRAGECRHYIHTDPGRNPIKENARAEVADIQVPSHYNHPRVNIGYMYVRWTPETANFFAQLFAYFVAKCPDEVLGYDHKHGTFVDLGLPDQNILDAFLRNHDFGHPKYRDIPWEKLKRIRWKLLDYNLFGIVGKNDANIKRWVTFHYAGEGRKVVCWKGICEEMRRQRNNKKVRIDSCIRQYAGGSCKKPQEGAPLSLQGSLPSSCLGTQIPCSKHR